MMELITILNGLIRFINIKLYQNTKTLNGSINLELI